MLATVLAKKIPVIIILFTTLPVNITALVPDPGVNAIIQAYYPQHWGGQAIADVLVGDYNPGGRLIATWPRAYDPVLHGDIGNYTMIGTNKTCVLRVTARTPGCRTPTPTLYTRRM